MPQKNVVKAMLMTEESLVKLLELSGEGEEFTIRIRKWLGTVSIKLVVSGEKLDFFVDNEMQDAPCF